MKHNISCAECRPLLPWYVSENLTPQERAAVDRHLVTCAECRQQLADWREIAGAAQYSRQVLQPPALSRIALWESLQAQIAVEGAVRTQNDEERSPMRTIDLGILPPTPAEQPPHHRPNTISWGRRIASVAAVALVAVIVISLINVFNTLAHRPSPAEVIVTVYAGQDINGNTLSYLLALRQSDGKELWQSPVLPNLSTPIVGDGLVFVTTSTQIPQRTSQGTLRLLAFDARSGQERWEYKTAAYSSQQILAGETIYLGSATLSTSETLPFVGTLTALAAGTGAVRWRTKLPGQTSSIVASGGILYVTTTNQIVTGQSVILDTYVTAVRASDGHILWNYDTQSQATLSSPPVLVGASIILSSSDSLGSASQQGVAVLIALDAQTGQRLWRTPIGATSGCGPECGPVAAQGMVFVAATNQSHGTSEIEAVDASTGAIVWNTPSQKITTPLQIVGDALSFGTQPAGGSASNLLDLSDGATRWQSPADIQAQPLLAANGVIYDKEALVPTTDAVPTWTLVARSAKNGQIIWRAPPGDIPEGAILSQGVLEVIERPLTSGALFQVVALINASNGKPLGSTTIDSGFSTIVLSD